MILIEKVFVFLLNINIEFYKNHRFNNNNLKQLYSQFYVIYKIV